MRIDLMSRMKLESGGIAIISAERLTDLIKEVTGKDYDEYQLLKLVMDHGGDMITMEPYQEISVGKIYTIDKDGTNSTIVRITPTINNSKRILKIGEKTAQEYCMQKTKELNVKGDDLGEFFIEQLKNYKTEMLSGE
jgi:hypothetical protein